MPGEARPWGSQSQNQGCTQTGHTALEDGMIDDNWKLKVDNRLHLILKRNLMLAQEKITIPVNAEIARTYKQASPEEQKKMDNSRFPNLNITQLNHFLRIFKINIQAIFNYTPRPYPSRIIFFRALEDSPGFVCQRVVLVAPQRRGGQAKGRFYNRGSNLRSRRQGSASTSRGCRSFLGSTRRRSAGPTAGTRDR